MSRVEEVYIPQKAVLWAFSSLDNYGNPVIASPVEIDCEWPQSVTSSNASQGDTESESDQIVVNLDIPLGSILWFGRYNDLTDSPTPLYKVVSRSNSPDIKGRNFRKSVGVALFRNTLPTVV